MTLELNKQQLQKLTHESVEIRLRALDQVEARFMRSLEHNELIAFNPVQMAKQLVRWFGIEPLQHAERVLALLLSLLRSSYAQSVYRKLSTERLRIELEKIRRIVRTQASAIELVNELQQVVSEQRQRDISVSEQNDENAKYASKNDNIYFTTESTSSENEALQQAPEDYELPWSRPTVGDVTTMKLMVDLLMQKMNDAEELEKVLVYVQITMHDYPAEYLLQTPHIFQKLLHLHEHVNTNCTAGSVSSPTLINRTLATYLKLLQKRIILRRETINYAAADTSNLGTAKIQLKPEVAMQLLISRCLLQLEPLVTEYQHEQWQLIELLMQTFVLYNLMAVTVPWQCVRQLATLAQRLQRFCLDTSSVALPRLKYMLLMSLLQDMITHNQRLTDFDVEETKNAVKLLQPLLNDYAWKVSEPKRFAELEQLYAAHQCGFEQQTKHLQKYLNSYELALAQLGKTTRLPPTELLMEQTKICLTIETLGSLRLIKNLFNAIVECNANYIEQPALLAQAQELLHTLLRLRNERLRLAVHKLLRANILRHFHCLMECENYAPGKTNLQLIAAHIFGVPLSVNLLQTLIMHGHEDANVEVQQQCLDCICLLLKTETLLGTNFVHVLELIQPLMPLLICLGCKNNDLQTLLLQLHHPDSSCLAYLPLLRGNLCYMFHPTAHVRNEAISRLVYMLNCKDQQCTLLPELQQIRDLLLDDISIVQPPRDFLYIFSDRTPGAYNGSQTMYNLLHLLETVDIEPLIRKTTLMQLNIMLQNWQAALQFCELEAYIFPLKSLHNSLVKLSAADYADAAIPAVGMLAKLFLVSANFLQQLVDREELHILLTRALFHFAHDVQLKQDASLCLFQLIFERFMQVTERGIQLPRIVAELHVPVTYTVATQASTVDSSTNQAMLRDYFADNEAAMATYWRLHIAHVICADDERIKLSKINDLDLDATYKLQKRELSLLEATQTTLQLNRYLNAASNATDHQTLCKLIGVLQLYLVQLRHAVPTMPHATTLQELLGKYLQLQPGNNMDYQLFAQMLELCNIAVRRHQLRPVIEGVSQALQSDINHGLIVLLKQKSTSLHLFEQITTCLAQLLAARGSFINGNLWFGSSFELLYTLCREYFEQRDLPRVRCLLVVLRQLSARALALSDRQLQLHCRHFVRLSNDLKANTQTGAQWQRDCLRIVCQLHAQMAQPTAIFRFSTGVLRFMTGLCGHNDAQVRALAWIILGGVAESFAADSSATHGIRCFLDEFKSLPGGFLACSLSTLLDHTETMLVRQFAGRIYASLFSVSPFEETVKLLETHSFLRDAHQSLARAALQVQLPATLDILHAGRLDSCEVIACYVHICVLLLQQQPAWCEQLIGHAFMHKLYELLKLPPTPFNAPFRRLCAHICQLYTLCYPSAFDFLQRTLCRDPVWLMSFVLLLDDMLINDVDAAQLVDVVRLLLVLCKDGTAYGYICQQLAQKPDVLVNLCMRAFELQQINTQLQRNTLGALTLLLIKSQPLLEPRPLSAGNSLISVLEQHVAPQRKLSRSNLTLDQENDMSLLNQQLEKLQITKSTNSLNTNQLLRNSLRSVAGGGCSDSGSGDSTRATSPTRSTAKSLYINTPCNDTNAAVQIYMDLDRLFTHLYPLKTCKFTQPPTVAQLQVCEALGVLLKLSPQAQEVAHNVRLLERLLKFLQNFLDDFHTPTSTFVRRNAEHKTQAVIRNLALLFQLILHWYSSHTAVITDEAQAARLIRHIVHIWSWLQHSSQLRHIVLSVCAFVTEHSFVVCKQTSVLAAGNAHSLLQLVVKYINFETTSVRAQSTETFPILQHGLRVMMNCCACTEGRLSLVKLHVLDIFDGLLPGHNATKQLKVKPELLNAWLRFWELFARYEQGAKACHLHALIATVQRATPRSTTRLLCLRILRNMCFLATNRAQLTSSVELMETMRDIIMQPMPALEQILAAGNVIVVDVNDSDEAEEPRSRSATGRRTQEHDASYEEQRLVTVSLWKLFGGSAKYKAMLRGTKLARQLRILREQLAAIEAEQPHTMRALPYALELADELDQVFKMLQN